MNARKKVVILLCLLTMLTVFSGCVGKGFVWGRIEVVAAESYAAALLAPNISQAAAYSCASQNPTDEMALLTAFFARNTYLRRANILVNLPPESANIDNATIYTDDASPVSPTGYIAITFDDGPHPTLTPFLLDALYARGILATFFLLGAEVERHPEIVARMYAEGHLIGNHSFSHPQLTHISRASAIDEIYRTNRSIEAITGSVPTTLRPPYGARNATVLDVARQMDMSVVLWSVDPRDWDNRVVNAVRNHVVNYATDGSIVLLHDIHQTSVDAAISAIDALIARGYAFVTVEELFYRNALSMQAGREYRSIYHTVGGSQ